MSVESVLQRVAVLEQALSNPASLLAVARTGGTAAPAGLAETAPEPASVAGGSSFADALQSANAAYAAPDSTTATLTPSADSSLATGVTMPPYSPTTGTLGTPTTSSTTPVSVAGMGSAPGAAPTILQTLGAPGTSPGARLVAVAESQAGQAEQPPGSNESPAIAQYRTATAGAIPGAPWCAYFASWAARQAGVPLGPQGEGLGAVSEIWSWAQSTGRAIPNGPGVIPQPGDLIVFGDEHVGIVKDVLPGGQIQTIEGNYENKVALNVRSPTEATGYVSLG